MGDPKRNRPAHEHTQTLIMNLDCLRNQWLVACPSRALSKSPVPITVLGTHLVLFRIGGVACALIDRCPHRNAPLSKGRIVEDGIQCPYHGWVFSPDGTCLSIPGLCGRRDIGARKAEPVLVKETNGFVWILLEPDAKESEPICPPNSNPRDSRFDSFLWVSSAPGNFVDALENLLDACHPHYTHAGWLRRPHERRSVQVRVRRTQDMAEAIYTENFRPKGLIPRLLEGERGTSIGRYYRPTTAQLEYAGRNGPRFLLTAWFTPIDEGNNLVHTLIATPKAAIPARIKELVLRVVFRQVLKQDQKALLDQMANIRRFGGPRFTSTELDVMRNHIAYLLRQTPSSPSEEFENTVEMEL
jgi:phenylpropionate dioxygenase-like ring-hydroxylating dioxygenase large terminal subunit